MIIKQGKNCNIHKSVVFLCEVEIGDNVTIFPNAVIGRPPMSSGATKRKIETKKNLPVIINDNSIVGCNAVIYSNVHIGNNSMISENACIREGNRIGAFVIIAMGVTINNNSVIGNYVRIMDNSHITSNVLIEDHVFVGPLVITENDNSIGRGLIKNEDQNGPIIRKFATIGGGANLLPDVEIGENAIVAANALVSRSVKPRTLVMGMPAKEKRKLEDFEIKK